MSTRGDPPKVSDHQQRRKDDEREFDKDASRSQYGRDSYRHSDRYSSRNSHGYSRYDEYSRREKRADEEEKHGRPRDHSRSDDKYSRDKYDSSQHSRVKETDSLATDRQKFRDKDASPDTAGAGGRHTVTISKEKDRDRRDRNSRDEKRDYHRSYGDLKSDRTSSYTESKGYRNDSSRVHHEGLQFRESYKNEQKELNGQEYGKKRDDWGSNRDKDRQSRALLVQNEDKTVYGFENQESLPKKQKSFSSERDTEEGKNANEKQKQIFEVDHKAVNSEVANDLNAAKVAAMKAAELVNKNLVGVGFMSTEQKKKLLWGNKKSTSSQEQSGNRWDTSLFDDRERQEKFNKLMSLRLPWYLWPIVGCEGRCEYRSQTRSRAASGEAERSPDGFGEAVYCWTSKKRRSHCWVGSLSVCLRSFCICIRMFDNLLCSLANVEAECGFCFYTSNIYVRVDVEVRFCMELVHCICGLGAVATGNTSSLKYFTSLDQTRFFNSN